MVLDVLEGKLDRTSELRASRAGRRDPLITSFEAYNWLSLGNVREAEAVASELPGERLNGHILVLAALGRPTGRAEALSVLEGFAGTGSEWMIRVEAAPLFLPSTGRGWRQGSG
jgi:hypothetical protein